MATAEKPADDRQAANDVLPGWPRVIRSKVFYGREDEHFFAIDADFDIVTQAATVDEALASLSRLLCSYLNSCVADGITLDEARRPIPVRLRLKLHAQAILTGPLHALRKSTAGTHESEILFPDSGRAHFV